MKSDDPLLDAWDETLARKRDAPAIFDSGGEPWSGAVTLEVSERSGAPFSVSMGARLDPGGLFEFPNVAPGEYRNDTGTPLMTIADLSRVWLASDVPESAIRLIRVGEHVTTTMVAYPGEAFEGRVARIADVLDPQTRTVKVYVDLANPGGRFRPEMFATIRWERDGLAVPLSQLQPVHADEQTTQVVEDWHYWVSRGYEF